MKAIRSVSLMIVMLIFAFAGNAKMDNSLKNEGEKTKVYYFHNKRRCPTCMAIEKETKKVLKEQPFAKAKESGDLVFKSYNAEDAINKKLVKKLGVTGSALIVIKGDQKIDLTSKGFMYGLKQPEKLREAIREALND